MTTDLREQVLLFLDFMSKYAHVDLQLLTMRQLLAQFEKETDSLLDKRERRLFADLTLAFVAKRQETMEAASAEKSPAISPAAASTHSSTSRAAPTAMSPPIVGAAAAANRLVSMASASPAGSECSQMSLDGIASLVRQSGARILPTSTFAFANSSVGSLTPIKSSGSLQQQPQQPSVSTYCVPVTSASSGHKQMIHIQVQRIPQLSTAAPVAVPTNTNSAASITNKNFDDEFDEEDDEYVIDEKQKSNSRPTPSKPKDEEESRRALSSRFSDLLRVHKESGLEFPKRQLASATDLAEKVALLEEWLLDRGLPWPLTLESARLFAQSNRIAAPTA